VNKDNVLFAVIGILLGFISGYLLHEVMAARQPPRLRAGDAAAAAAMGAGGGGEGAPGDAGGQAPEGPGGAAGPGGPGGAGGAQGAPVMAAIQQLRDRLAKNPNDDAAVLQLANANFEIQRWDKAQELYLRYLQMKPNQPGPMTDLGVTYRNQGQFQQALDLFHQAAKIDPTNWQSRYNAVVVLGIDLKRFDEAQQALVELRKMQPGNPEVEKLATAIESRRKAAA
jgi:predicted Zn-dependent protease